MKMQIGRWGNSLAVRLPKTMVDQMGLREGDEIDLSGLQPAAEQAIQRRRDEAIAAIRDRAWFPASFKFDRETFYDELLEERHGRS